MGATYKQGNTLMLDYTPSTAKSAGDVVVVGEEPRIVHQDIEANQLGAIAAPAGTAVYVAPKETGASKGWSDGAVIYWDATNTRLTNSAAAGANKKIGYGVGTAGDNDATAQFRHST